jgi:hypothetical protein
MWGLGAEEEKCAEEEKKQPCMLWPTHLSFLYMPWKETDV